MHCGQICDRSVYEYVNNLCKNVIYLGQQNSDKNVTQSQLGEIYIYGKVRKSYALFRKMGENTIKLTFLVKKDDKNEFRGTCNK